MKSSDWNLQVDREETRTAPRQSPKVLYYLGWGERDTLEGDPLTFEQLKAFHALVGRVIEQIDKPNKGQRR